MRVKDRRGKYLVNSFEFLLIFVMSNKRISEMWKVVLVASQNSICSFIAWLGFKKDFKTFDKLAYIGHQVEDKNCSLFKKQEENLDQNFFNCEFYVKVLMSVFRHIIQWGGNMRWKDWINWSSTILPDKDRGKVRMLFNPKIYLLWQERNRRAHNEPPSNVWNVHKRVCELVNAIL